MSVDPGPPTRLERRVSPGPPARPATLRPADLREARDAVRDSAGALLFTGGGTKQDWGGPPRRVDTVVETTSLARLVEHSAGDMIAICQAGLPLRRLQEALAPAGQWLALDPPLADEGATVGGLFASNDAGPRRLRYGAMRDLVIGVTVVLADGAVARAGGRVVKNVAGYDLMRLLCGSFGTLGLVTELVVRLHPRPESSATLRIDAGLGDATRLVLDLLAAPVEPSAVEVAGGAVWVRLEGREAGVAAQADAVRRLAGTDAAVLAAEQQAAAWASLTAAHAGGPAETVARAATLPDRLQRTHQALVTAAEQAGVAAEATSSAALGLHTARLQGDDRGCAAAVAAWRMAVAALGGTVTLRRASAGVAALVDPWPRLEPAALDVMRRVKARLDPDGRCAPGRFAGGL